MLNHKPPCRIAKTSHPLLPLPRPRPPLQPAHLVRREVWFKFDWVTSAQGFTFAYKVRMEYTGDASASGSAHYRLERRRWEIVDAAGETAVPRAPPCGVRPPRPALPLPVRRARGCGRERRARRERGGRGGRRSTARVWLASSQSLRAAQCSSTRRAARSASAAARCAASLSCATSARARPSPCAARRSASPRSRARRSSEAGPRAAGGWYNVVFKLCVQTLRCFSREKLLSYDDAAAGLRRGPHRL